MAGRLLSHDDFTGITSYFHYDAATDTAVIEKKQDVGLILDNNKAERNSGVNNKDYGLGKKVATVPLVLYWQWKNHCTKANMSQDETSAYILGMIKSREYCHLMTVDKI